MKARMDHKGEAEKKKNVEKTRNSDLEGEETKAR
jgi:hypothetical protein